MKKIINALLVLINIWRILPVLIIINLQKKNTRTQIKEEIIYWKKCAKLNYNGIVLLTILLLKHKEYRNLLCYRLKSCKGLNTIFFLAVKTLFPNISSLFITCPSIGRNLYIQHGFATYIAAKSIGENCWINQQVTIGYTFDNTPPTIGNGVRISAGAKVLGNITVGDNVIVAANAVVVKDVAENMIVGGVPSKIIGENTSHILYTTD